MYNALCVGEVLDVCKVQNKSTVQFFKSQKFIKRDWRRKQMKYGSFVKEFTKKKRRTKQWLCVDLVRPWQNPGELGLSE
jgi:hypothetical protein